MKLKPFTPKDTYWVRVAGALVVFLTALASVWALGWLGHLLNSRWPVDGFLGLFSSWWTLPFGFTTLTILAGFTESINYLATQIGKKA